MVKTPPVNTGDLGSIPGSRRSAGEGNGNPLQYSRLRGNPWTEEPGELQSMGLKSQMQYEHILWCRKLKRFEVEENMITLKV